MAQIELAQHQIWAGSVGICDPQVPLQLVPCLNASCIPRCLRKGQLLPEDGKASVGEVPFPVNLSSRLCQHRHRLNSARMWLSCSAVCSAVQLSLSSEGEEFSGAAACAALLGLQVVPGMVQPLLCACCSALVPFEHDLLIQETY